MATLRRFFPNFSSAFWLVISLAVWTAFAPRPAGGLASYVMIIGNSMEPGFHLGDLVITHRQLEYATGDAVVYRNDDLRSYVFHRIVSQDSSRFTLQGDNNSFTDTYQPTREEILGKFWMRVPRGGIFFQKIRTPIVMALLAGGLGGLLALSLFEDKTRGKKRMNRKSLQEWFFKARSQLQRWLEKLKNAASNGKPDLPSGNILEALFFILGLVAFVSFILAIIVFSRPAAKSAKDSLAYEHVGSFSYSGPAPQGIYDSKTLTGGDPIFPKLTCSINVNFQYRLVAQNATGISGTYQLNAVVSDPASGWERTVELQDKTKFDGNTFLTDAVISLCQIESITHALEASTDYHPGSYVLTVSPQVELSGKISDRTFNSQFSPQLTFLYDRLNFHLIRDEEQGDPLAPSKSGSVDEMLIVPNTILLLGWEASVPALRWTAVILLALSLGGLFWLVSKIQQTSKTDSSEFFRIRYESLMVDVQNTPSMDSSNMISVASLDDLAKLAERFNSMILHLRNGDEHRYLVSGEGDMYQVTVKEPANSPATGMDAPKPGGGKS